MRFLPRLAFALAALAPLPAAGRGLAIVMNSDGASISLIDMSTHKEIGRTPALREPHHWALTPDGKTLLVGDSSGNALLELDPNTGALKGRVPCSDPYQLGFSPDGKYLVINGLARNQVDILDGKTYKLVHRFPIRSMPSHLAFSPDGSRVFVSLQGTNSLVAYDLRDMKQLWVKHVGSTPAGVLWLHGKILVADMGTDYVAEVDPEDGKVLRHILTGRGAHNLFLSPDGKTLWVDNRAGGTTSELDADSFVIRRVFKVARGPDDLAFAPNGDLWITRRFGESVAILNPKTGEITDAPTGRSPHGIFLNPEAATPSKVADAR
jgi:DNA-binding beta-propeller fold protein YncE